ncbi:hypothetical protein [Ekhidna sp.]|uniref:hypothetical protein n=1 Tax=Ekhidna sp. TaxID=2608089 RepID=UPI003299807B
MTFSKRKIILKTFFILILALSNLLSCSIPEPKQAQFEREVSTIIYDLKQLNGFEDADIQIAVKSFNGKTHHILSIALINGPKSSYEDEVFIRMSKNALKIVIESILNENDYDLFKVTLLRMDKNGLVIQKKTRVFDFLSDDLKTLTKRSL